MGTSSSSKGPGGGVPMVPPWVPPLPPLLPPLPPEAPPDAGPDQDGPPPAQDIPQPLPPAPPNHVAPPRRFSAARTSLGHFSRSGSGDDLRRGLGHYSRTGLGGSTAATRRMGGTVVTAGGLYGVLSALSSGARSPVDLGVDAAELRGRPAAEVADRIANALRPSDGTQDTEAARDAISRAISDLVAAEPEVDLLALSPEQIGTVVEGYVAHDLCHRIELDVGKAVHDKAPDPATATQRLEQMKDYVRQEVARCFRARSDRGQRLDRQGSATLAASVLRDVFEVFEGYLQ
ncbi:Qat anti-phage system associated protein QatB [Methylobacterium sp. J-078]|uniref:Qat anti-phage system associated protein QatB n=1 Tax=Methylobacterium sp. J-078 TaxID=2836657 RepID=UPI0028BD37F1|nr:Qat anti-phage system associated protein QatB [Methylobacterium sp. J-078]